MNKSVQELIENLSLTSVNLLHHPYSLSLSLVLITGKRERVGGRYDILPTTPKN